MSSDRAQIDPVSPNRGALLVVLVVMGLCVLGSPSLRQMRDSSSDEIVFGASRFPTITRLDSDLVINEWGLHFTALPDWTTYEIRRGPRTSKPVSVVMINRAEAMVCEIRRFDSDTENWPPRVTQYGGMSDLLDLETWDQDSVDDRLEGSIVRTAPNPIRTIIAKLDDGEVEWTSLELCRTWPHRTHIGKVNLRDKVFHVTIRELHAKTNPPNYQSAPFADVFDAIRLYD